MNTTQEQKENMLQWMKLNPDVARGRLRRKGESKKQMTILLEDLSNTMNSAHNGPVKTSSEWYKTWKDWKMYVLKKETKRRTYSVQTGGGSPKQIFFSDLEERLLEFLTAEAAGLEDIPQGGIYLNKNINFGSQKSNNSNIMERECSYFEENENVAPYKRLHPNVNTSATNFKEPKLQSMTNKMILLQEDKITLKKEEIHIQRELLEIHRSALGELQKIRSILDTFGSLQ